MYLITSIGCSLHIICDLIAPIGHVMRTCPQRLLKLHINMFMMGQLHEAVQNYYKKRWTHSYLKLTSIYLRMLYCLNVLLWFYLGMYIKKIGTSSNQPTNSRQPVRTSPNQFRQPVWTTKRNTHNSWFSKDLKAHEYPLERLWSLLSNPTSFMSFRLPNQDLWSNHWRLLRMSRVCPRIYLAQLPMQDCTILHCFMAHATQAWKAYQV